MQLPGREYEFDQEQNTVFAKLASAMKFVGVAMFLPGIVFFLPFLMWQQGLFGHSATSQRLTPAIVLFGLPGVLILVMGINLYRAAACFKDIVKTSRTDIRDLMVAMNELVLVYRIQRWLWVVIGFLLTFAFVGELAVQ